MNKVLFISGLGHSGSTFLQLILGKNKNFFCIGEAGNVIKDVFDNSSYKLSNAKCSCNKNYYECAFWKKVIPQINKSKTEIDALNCILKNIEITQDNIIIDSSKRSKFYKWYSKTESDIFVIYMIRDFRSWAFSAIDLKKRKSDQNRRRYGYIYECYRWMFENIRDLLFFKQKRANVLFVSYERLVFNFENEINRVYKFMSIDSSIGLDNNTEENIHILLGNRMRNDENKKNIITYNAKWLFSPTVALSSILVLPVYIINQYFYYLTSSKLN